MADKSLWPLLNQRGYAPIEFSSVLFLPRTEWSRLGKCGSDGDD